MAFGESTRRSWKTTAIWLAIWFLLALTLRVGFSMEGAYDDATGQYTYAHNDPYYHDHSVRHILDTGETLRDDPLLRYPSGSVNPNPPLYLWTVAALAKGMDAAGLDAPVFFAANIIAALFGALTVFPVYIVGRELWGRRVGLWAAFFMAVSAAHMQRGVWGFADHQTTTVFFIALTFAFLLTALNRLRVAEYVSSWRDVGAVGSGMRSGLASNHEALLWSALAGTAMTATALVWKGYPYALAVMAIAFGFQLLGDHVRNRDSTPLTAVYLLPVAMCLVLSAPYYFALGLEGTTFFPTLYVLLGMLLVGAILVPTRELPSVLVFPALLLASGLGLVLLLVVFPDVGRLIFSGMGYFEQTKLYSTIGEAQRTELGSVAAAFGFFTFVLAFWAFGRSIKQAYRGSASMMLMAAWGAVALFMAFAAARFVFNASPVFAVFVGAGTAWIMDKAAIHEVVRRMRSRHGQGRVRSAFRSMTWRSTLVVVLVAVFLVLPNMWIGVDAATSREFEGKHGLTGGRGVDRLGAYGVQYDIRHNGWLGLSDFLSQQNQHLAPEDRPAFMGWWDYGHYAVAIGGHPAVADPFQNQYQIAARFLGSDGEMEAISWLVVLLANRDLADGGFSPGVRAALSQHGVDPDEYAAARGLEARQAVLSNVTYIPDLYHDIVDATGHHVGYLGVDSRMYPFGPFNPGIFYAPAYLANKNPDDYMQYVYRGVGLEIRMQQYEVDEAGDSVRLREPLFLDSRGQAWVVSQGLAYPAQGFIPGAVDPALGNPVEPDLQVSPLFAESMYALAYGGPSVAQQPAGDGLAHWRLVYQATVGQGVEEFRLTALLEYYRGHAVSGRVVDGDGQAVPSVVVTFVDEFGASHDAAFTGSDGLFEIRAPFGELQLTVRTPAGQVLHQQPMAFTREQANTPGAHTDDVTVVMQNGRITGHVYRDLDGSNTFNATVDLPIGGATVSLAGRTATTGPDGAYAIDDVPAGAHTLRVSHPTHQEASASIVVPSNATMDRDVALQLLPSNVTVTFEADGQGVSGVPVQFSGPQTQQVTTGDGGVATLQLRPGTYTVEVDHAIFREGVEVVYQASTTITIPEGGAPFAFTLEAS